MVNSGQFCAAGTRIFVQEGVYDEYVERAVKFASNLKLGGAFEEGVFLGPVISEVQFNKVMAYIDSGKEQGATLLTGGNRASGREGFFIEPTVFGDVQDEMKIAQEEIFGPVMSILKFKDIDEVIERANNTPYGLAAAVQTTNLNSALKISENLRAG